MRKKKERESADEEWRNQSKFVRKSSFKNSSLEMISFDLVPCYAGVKVMNLGKDEKMSL